MHVHTQPLRSSVQRAWRREVVVVVVVGEPKAASARDPSALQSRYETRLRSMISMRSRCLRRCTRHAARCRPRARRRLARGASHSQWGAFVSRCEELAAGRGALPHATPRDSALRRRSCRRRSSSADARTPTASLRPLRRSWSAAAVVVANGVGVVREEECGGGCGRQRRPRAAALRRVAAARRDGRLARIAPALRYNAADGAQRCSRASRSPRP